MNVKGQSVQVPIPKDGPIEVPQDSQEYWVRNTPSAHWTAPPSLRSHTRATMKWQALPQTSLGSAAAKRPMARFDMCFCVACVENQTGCRRKISQEAT